MRYEIEQYEIHVMVYQVEADSEVEAIVALFDGKAEPTEMSQEFLEGAWDLGLPADDNPKLVKGLENRGFSIREVIPSIRSVKAIK